MLLTTSSDSAGIGGGTGGVRAARHGRSGRAPPPLPEAPLTCKLLQGVPLLQFPGDLGVRQDFLAHGRQHHGGVHRVYPDLGPRGHRRWPRQVDEPPPPQPLCSARYLGTCLLCSVNCWPAAQSLGSSSASPMPSAAHYNCQPLPLLLSTYLAPASPPLRDPPGPPHAHLIWPQLCGHDSGEYGHCALGGACGERAALRTP